MSSKNTVVICTGCGTAKPEDEFYVYSGRMRRPCKECTKARSKATYHRLKAEDPEALAVSLRARNRRINLAQYGLTLDDYDALYEAQGGHCAICGKVTDYNLAVDHCHDTGVVRGLLCIPCNVGIGNLGDDPDRLRAAVDYLEARRG